MKYIAIVASLLLVTVLPITGVAIHENEDDDIECSVSASVPDQTYEDYAIFFDDDQLPGAISVWIYEENGNFPGIQRHDSVVQDELCQHSEFGDTIVF